MPTTVRCPRCAIDLKVTMRHDVEVDICPSCLGVWLDRGEIDTIVNRLAVGDRIGFPDDVSTDLDDALDPR